MPKQVTKICGEQLLQPNEEDMRGVQIYMWRDVIVMLNIVTKVSEISTSWWKPLRMCTLFLSFVSCGGVHGHCALLCCVNYVDHVGNNDMHKVMRCRDCPVHGAT